MTRMCFGIRGFAGWRGLGVRRLALAFRVIIQDLQQGRFPELKSARLCSRASVATDDTLKRAATNSKATSTTKAKKPAGRRRYRFNVNDARLKGRRPLHNSKPTGRGVRHGYGDHSHCRLCLARLLGPQQRIGLCRLASRLWSNRCRGAT
jgi:hypothetical protein